MTKILLVEDDKSLREIYGVRLLAEGYDIVSAGDGEEALAMAIKEKPSLIVSDVMMPKISGFDMLDILRSTTETKDIKVIMMTALSSEDQRARGEALGADRYLVKSQVGIEDVVRTVHDVLGDAPVAGPTAAQTFGLPGPSAIANPQRPAPVIQPTPIAAIVPPVSQVVAAPVPYSVPQMTSPPVTTVGTSLPQPTAPFSTPRPANLASRVIHPIERSDVAQPDISRLISQELSQASAVPATEPAPLQTPQPFSPTPQPVSTNATMAPSPFTTTTPQPPTVEPPHNLNFEETPYAPSSSPTDQPQ